MIRKSSSEKGEMIMDVVIRKNVRYFDMQLIPKIKLNEIKNTK